MQRRQFLKLISSTAMITALPTIANAKVKPKRKKKCMTKQELGPLNTYAKGIATDPAALCTFAAEDILKQPTQKGKPLIDAAQGVRCPEFGQLPSVEWLATEMEWLDGRKFDAIGQLTTVAGFPFAFPERAVALLKATSRQQWGPWVLDKTVNTLTPTTDLASAYLSPKQDLGASGAPIASDLNTLAHLCRNDIGAQFFEEYLVANKAKIIVTKPGAFSREGGILHELAELTRIHQIAMNRAFLQKYATPLARPEELFARQQRSLTMLYNEGAPRHPSFVSGHAACAGAGSAYLFANLALTDDDKADVISLAELTFLGRWAAGIHWVADGIAGLHGGWQIACRAMGVELPSPWQRSFDSLQAL